MSSYAQFFIHKNFLSWFYLLIFYFEKFSTRIWRFPFAVYVTLKLSINKDERQTAATQTV